MSAQRLYKAEWVTDENGEAIVDTDTMPWVSAGFRMLEPEGWREYALEMWPVKPEHEVWPNGHKPFFWPSTDKIFRSRSSAQARVDIINRWGGKAVLVECTPQWETVEAANARRKAARVQDRIERKARETLALMREYQQLTGELPDIEEMAVV